jgi:hypothetical protein
MKTTYTGAVSIALTLFALAQPVKAEVPEYHIVIQNHAFEPSNIKIPANSKVILIVENRDESREEFESESLQQEKVIKPNRSKKIYIGPLNPGEYSFFGDFHPTTARGMITVE